MDVSFYHILLEGAYHSPGPVESLRLFEGVSIYVGTLHSARFRDFLASAVRIVEAFGPGKLSVVKS